MQLHFSWVSRHRLHLSGNQLVGYVTSAPHPTPRLVVLILKANPKGTLGTGSAGLAVGGAYLAVAAGIDHLVAELGVARQDAPVDRAGGGDDLAVAAQ